MPRPRAEGSSLGSTGLSVHTGCQSLHTGACLQVPLWNIFVQQDAHILYTAFTNCILCQQKNQCSLASETKPNNPKLHYKCFVFMGNLNLIHMQVELECTQAVQLRQEAVNFTLLLWSSVSQHARNVLEQWKTQRNPS